MVFIKFNLLEYPPHLKKFEKFLYDERYDTDAFLLDLEDIGYDKSNVALLLSHKPSYDGIKQHLRDLDLQSSSFSIGYIFYYWPYYAKKGRTRKQFYANTIDHSGHEPYELYIESKYEDLKDELLNNEQHQLNLDE